MAYTPITSKSSAASISTPPFDRKVATGVIPSLSRVHNDSWPSDSVSLGGLAPFMHSSCDGVDLHLVTHDLSIPSFGPTFLDRYSNP